MKKDFTNIIKVSCIYSASVIGAGFASGREIFQFFTNYHEGGFYGIVFAGLLFSVIGYMVLDRVYEESINSYDELIFSSMGFFAGKVIQIAVPLFVLSLFSVMIAGMGKIFEEKLCIPFIYSVIFIAFICMLFLFNNIKGITVAGTVLTPVLITGMLLIGLYIIIFKDLAVVRLIRGNRSISNNWLVSSILYVSYNSIMSIVVMCSLLPYLSSRRVARIGSILGGLMLCLIAFIINTVIYLFLPQSALYEIPMLAISQKYSSIINTLYTIILWLAMFVSAITSRFCFVERISSMIRLKNRTVAVLACVIVIPLSFIGFSDLIKTVYPFFGYIGLLIILMILYQGITKRK